MPAIQSGVISLSLPARERERAQPSVIRDAKIMRLLVDHRTQTPATGRPASVLLVPVELAGVYAAAQERVWLPVSCTRDVRQRIMAPRQDVGAPAKAAEPSALL